MRLDGLTDDAILHVAQLLHEQPLLGVPAVRALHRCQRRLRWLLQRLVAAQRDLRERAAAVTYAWSVPRFSELRKGLPPDATLRSPEFCTAFGHGFRFLLFPNGNKNKRSHVSLYVEVADVLCSGWERHATFSLQVLHKNDPLQDRVCNEQTLAFTASNSDWGFRFLIQPEELSEFLAEDGTLRVQVSVTVTPPTADIDAACRLWASGAASVRALQLLVPSMIGHLQHALAATDVAHEWSVCPSCGARLAAPPTVAAARDESARMRCATKGCAGCAVATSHALLRKFVAREAATECEWRKWPWPVHAARAFKPEDLATTTVSQKLKEVLSSDGLRNKLVAQFENDLKAVL